MPSLEKPVLLTGITGFIAKRIALDLLEAGYSVRGSLRSVARADEVRATLARHLSDPAALDRLEFVELDLGQNDGWEDALQGVGALLHTASPFPLAQPRDEQVVIRPAVDGALRALRAAHKAGVHRVVMTSSVVAIGVAEAPPGTVLTEDDWADPDHPTATPYSKSKTLAERAAWDFVASHPEMQLTAINPALVLGSPLDGGFGTSLQAIERIWRAKDPLQPEIGFGIVDVADISAMHIRALERPETVGRRYIGSNGSRTFPQIAAYLAKRHPERRISTRVAPMFALRVLGIFDPAVRSILPTVGRLPEYDSSRAQSELDIEFTPADTSIDRAVEAIREHRG